MEPDLMLLGILLIFSIAWHVCGYKIFVYWWTSKHDFTTEVRWTALNSSYMGPFIYFRIKKVMNSNDGDIEVKIIKKRRNV